MKKITPFLSFLLLLGLIYYSFYGLMPQSGSPDSVPETEFSTARALVPLREISKAPHYHGSVEHQRVREYLVSRLEDLGLETEIQEGFVLNNSGKSLDKPKNIVARIKGSGKGKSLLLLSHYDTALVPSPGASDAGSGVVTILESVRAYLASGNIPKNDIIVLFSDAEEIGLDGAKLFVNEHPWAKNIGLVLNFEARGSGGPSNMILETNGGNSNLIKAFMEANPQFPVASSLMYSVYKMLPNDTDSTVFREDGDIDSFFFAFIDDHFDYHTANDTVENLDIKTLQHQGSYLLPLLHYFAKADLSQLKSDTDSVYVNMPFIKMIAYPFSWILPLLIIAVVMFIALVFYGISKRKILGKEMIVGFVPFLLSLIICGAIGYIGWIILLKMYPHYNEIQHGFKYNGHSYVAFFVLLSLAILFKFYKGHGRKKHIASLFIAPLLLWIIVNIVVFFMLKGAGYFIIPVFFGLISLWVLIKYETPNLLFLALLASPAIFLFVPLIQFFPVGLGSSMVVISCVFTVLLFGLLLPVFGNYRWKNILSVMCLLAAIGFFIHAHATSDFSEKRQKPNSLVYYEDADSGKSYWLTYDKILDPWTQKYLGEKPEAAYKYVKTASGSKYRTGYTFAQEATFKKIPGFELILKKDSVVGEMRNVVFVMSPQRKVNQIELFTKEDVVFNSLSFNGKEMKNLNHKKDELLLRYYVAGNDSLEIAYSVPKNSKTTFMVKEASFDLLLNPYFSIDERPKNMMPKPFVVTDALVLKKTFSVDSIPLKIKDSISETIETNE